MYDVWCMMYDVWCMMYDVWCMMYECMNVWMYVYKCCVGNTNHRKPVLEVSSMVREVMLSIRGEKRYYAGNMPISTIHKIQGMVYDVWCMMCDVWCMMYDVWCMMYDVWCMTYDVWCSCRNLSASACTHQPLPPQSNHQTHTGVYVWCMMYDVWWIMYDVWCMMYDVWCMMYDVWCMMYDVWMYECMMYDVWMYDVWMYDDRMTKITKRKRKPNSFPSCSMWSRTVVKGLNKSVEN